MSWNFFSRVKWFSSVFWIGLKCIYCSGNGWVKCQMHWKLEEEKHHKKYAVSDFFSVKFYASDKISNDVGDYDGTVEWSQVDLN